MLDLPWTTEANLPYGEHPRIYDATGALVAVVGNAEIDKQDDWERNATAIVNAVNSLSTITPAEVGGLWVPANPEHAKLGWSYDFEQTERIARAAYDSTGYDATMEVVEFVMAEADRRHRDALTTERAAHAEARRERDEAFQKYVDANEARIDAEAQRDEALKAQNYLKDAVLCGLSDQEIARRARLLVEATRRALTGGKKDG